MRPERDRILQGLAVSPGIAIGPAHVTEEGEIPVPDYRVDDPRRELERFDEALAVSKKQLKKLKAKAAGLPESAAEEMGLILDAHLSMLSSSRLLRGVTKRVEAERQNVERAVQAEIHAIGESFSAMGDAYLAARFDDVRIVGTRLLRNLTKTPYVAFKHLPEGSIVLAEELTPADTALLDPRRIAGFATVLGGTESHTAIMARALRLPAVVGVAGLLGAAGPGAMTVIDGRAGVVILDASEETIAAYRQRQEALADERRGLAKLRKLPSVTRDQVEIKLQANLELPQELDQAVAAGAVGVGLVRTEFLFMNRDDLPDEEEQYEAYRAIVVGMDGRPVTIRTLDIGGDKLSGPLAEQLGADMVNPALGMRAIRLSLKDRKLLDAQLAAILRAAAHGPVRVLLPLISSVSEIRRVRTAMVQVARRLKRRGVRLPEELPPLGAMIEVPGAALAADALAAEADFFSIGTNDLIQYTLAIDRSDEQLAPLYNPLHPAVLRLIQFTIEAALRARLPCCLCGEMAGDPRYTALLLGLGIRDLSMAPGNIPRVKQRIRSLDIVAATRRSRAVMDQWDDGRIAALIDDFNALA
jgi:phosphotransferase system enzyme I (PtsI)